MCTAAPFAPSVGACSGGWTAGCFALGTGVAVGVCTYGYMCGDMHAFFTCVCVCCLYVSVLSRCRWLVYADYSSSRWLLLFIPVLVRQQLETSLKKERKGSSNTIWHSQPSAHRWPPTHLAGDNSCFRTRRGRREDRRVCGEKQTIMWALTALRSASDVRTGKLQ